MVAVKQSTGEKILLGASLSSAERSTISLPYKYCGVGDEAFMCCDTLLTPWSGRGLSIEKDSFNFYLSSMRQCIERAFGLLFTRWGIFRRGLQFQAKRRALVASVRAELHNFCIEKRQGKPPPPRRDVGQEDQTVFFDNGPGPSEEDRRGLYRVSRRTGLTGYLRAIGACRPPPVSSRRRS